MVLKTKAVSHTPAHTYTEKITGGADSDHYT